LNDVVDLVLPGDVTVIAYTHSQAHAHTRYTQARTYIHKLHTRTHIHTHATHAHAHTYTRYTLARTYTGPVFPKGGIGGCLGRHSEGGAKNCAQQKKKKTRIVFCFFCWTEFFLRPLLYLQPI